MHDDLQPEKNGMTCETMNAITQIATTQGLLAAYLTVDWMNESLTQNGAPGHPTCLGVAGKVSSVLEKAEEEETASDRCVKSTKNDD